jgi:hypothetical protein
MDIEQFRMIMEAVSAAGEGAYILGFIYVLTPIAKGILTLIGVIVGVKLMLRAFDFCIIDYDGLDGNTYPATDRGRVRRAVEIEIFKNYRWDRSMGGRLVRKGEND